MLQGDTETPTDLCILLRLASHPLVFIQSRALPKQLVDIMPKRDRGYPLFGRSSCRSSPARANVTMKRLIFSKSNLGGEVQRSTRRLKPAMGGSKSLGRML